MYVTFCIQAYMHMMGLYRIFQLVTEFDSRYPIKLSGSSVKLDVGRYGRLARVPIG